MYSALLDALGLRKQKPFLLFLARPKAGRKAETELAARILALNAEGKTVRETIALFEAEGQFFSKEKVEFYRQTRRTTPKS